MNCRLFAQIRSGHLSHIHRNPISLAISAQKRMILGCFGGILGPGKSLAISPFIAIPVDHLRQSLASKEVGCFSVQPSLLPSLAAPDGLVKTRFLQRVA
jgi:hypothetical protein